MRIIRYVCRRDPIHHVAVEDEAGNCPTCHYELEEAEFISAKEVMELIEEATLQVPESAL